MTNLGPNVMKTGTNDPSLLGRTAKAPHVGALLPRRPRCFRLPMGTHCRRADRDAQATSGRQPRTRLCRLRYGLSGKRHESGPSSCQDDRAGRHLRADEQSSWHGSPPQTDLSDRSRPAMPGDRVLGQTDAYGATPFSRVVAEVPGRQPTATLGNHRLSHQGAGFHPGARSPHPRGQRCVPGAVRRVPRSRRGAGYRLLRVRARLQPDRRSAHDSLAVECVARLAAWRPRRRRRRQRSSAQTFHLGPTERGPWLHPAVHSRRRRGGLASDQRAMTSARSLKNLGEEPESFGSRSSVKAAVPHRHG